MSWGFDGPIGSLNLATYAIARTYVIRSAKANTYEVTCKGCGHKVLTQYAWEVDVLTRSNKFTACYFCVECFTPIRDANEAFPNWYKDRSRRPHWWSNFYQEPGRRVVEGKRYSEEEIDRMIKARQAQLQLKGE